MQREMVDWIRDIVTLGIRRPGSPQNLATEQYLAEKFREIGLTDIRLEPVDVHHWDPAETELSIAASDRHIPCFAVPYTAWWPLDRLMAVDPYLFGPEPPCDSAPFFTAGIPSVCHISGPLYLFDPHDTIDKVRAVDLPRVAGLFRELVEAIDVIPASALHVGLQRGRDDGPPPLPPWFQPPPDAEAESRT
jgi:hypothetical protein